jgi:hypothetical protein
LLSKQKDCQKSLNILKKDEISIHPDSSINLRQFGFSSWIFNWSSLKLMRTMLCDFHGTKNITIIIYCRNNNLRDSNKSLKLIYEPNQIPLVYFFSHKWAYMDFLFFAFLQQFIHRLDFFPKPHDWIFCHIHERKLYAMFYVLESWLVLNESFLIHFGKINKLIHK